MAEEGMERLKIKRSTLRTAVTKLLNKIEGELSKEEVNIEELELDLEQLAHKGGALRAIDEAYERIVKTEELAKECETAETYQENIIRVRYSAMKRVRLGGERPNVANIDSSFLERSVEQCTVNTNNLKLPKLEIAKFDGKIENWVQFWSQYDSAIHSNGLLTKIAKFNYLKMLLTNSVLISLEGLIVSEDNYDIAIDALKAKYDQKDIAVGSHMKKLLQLSPVKKSSNIIEFRSFYEKCMIHVRSLEALGIELKSYGNLLFPVVAQSIPEDIMLDFNRKKLQKEDQWDISKLLEFVKEEIEFRERTSLYKKRVEEETHNSSKRQHQNAGDDFLKRGYSAAGLFVKNQNRQLKCNFCDEAHWSAECKASSGIPLAERKQLLAKRGCCFVCLKVGHIASRCASKIKCTKCFKRHYQIMCPQSEIPPKFAKAEAEDKGCVLANQTCSVEVMMQTLTVRVYGNEREHLIRALIDTGSQRSYITEDIANKMGYESEGSETLTHCLFGGVQTEEQSHKKYRVVLGDIKRSYKCNFIVLGQARICKDIPKIRSASLMKELGETRIVVSDLAKCGNCLKRIDLLIGADIAGKLLTGNIHPLENGPVAIETYLGWTVMGKLVPDPGEVTCDSLSVTSLFIRPMDISELWKLDTLGILDPAESKKGEDMSQASLEFFSKSIKRSSDGRYEVSLPWIDHPHLPSNKEMAEKRLTLVKRRLETTGMLDAYNDVLQDWDNQGIIEEVPKTEDTNVGHYLPHRPVIRLESETTKIRPVFDASAKAKNCVSLNDCLEKGPNMLDVIPSLLNKFRKFRYGVTADIEKAFLQISVRKEDRDYLRFQWFQEGYEERRTYRHTRVVFGLKSSPFLLNATLKYHLEDDQTRLKGTASLLRRSFYVDNCLTSFETLEEIQDFKTESQELLSSAHFNLRDWKCNGLSDANLPNESIHVLGLLWDLKEDTLSCKLDKIKVKESECFSKRKVLSVAQQLFDPVGYTCPVSLVPKLLLQDSWDLKVSWDEDLPEPMNKKFRLWLNQLHLLSLVQIPRWLGLDKTKDQEITLHVFCDASKAAYATCAFLRVESKTGVSVQLVQAKTRVAPLKRITIPRLELMACVIGSRLANFIKNKIDIEDLKVVLWTDSTNALAWICRNEQWNVFVRNRIKEIRDLTDVNNWRYVPGSENPADLPSRGCSARQFVQLRWWEGPLWLRQDETTWPKVKIKTNEVTVNQEKCKTTCSTSNVTAQVDWFYNQFSSYKKIVRVLSWMKRFCKNARTLPTDRLSSDITLEEYLEAEETIWKIIQRESFSSIKDPRIASLRPFIDEKGIIKTSTKISEREDSRSFRFPVILPFNHVITKLLIKEIHEENSHAGIQTVMTILRERFWVLRCRRVVRQEISNCLRCKRFRVKSFEAPQAPLPKDRVKDCVVFHTTGIDLAGPLYLRHEEKAWVVIFTCAVYRSVHLELATSLSTESFLQCLRKFIARRGRPQEIYSDNGTNFKGAENLFKTIDWQEVEKAATIKRIKWKFNPPLAAWWGGWWERLIRILKDLLKSVLGRSSLNYEEMLTTLCEVENIVNCRPLTYVSEDIDDLQPLTPNMFLRDNIEGSTADFDYINGKELNKRWRYRKKLRENLRKRFRVQYLGQLKYVQKKKKFTEPVRLGHIVLIGSDNTKRQDWPLGKVTNLYTGKDGITRVVKVRTKGGEVIRPIQRLYPFEMEDGQEKPERLTIPDLQEGPVPTDQTSATASQGPSHGSVPGSVPYDPGPDDPDSAVESSDPVHDSETQLFGKEVSKVVSSRTGRVVKRPLRFITELSSLSTPLRTQGGEDVASQPPPETATNQSQCCCVRTATRDRY